MQFYHSLCYVNHFHWYGFKKYTSVLKSSTNAERVQKLLESPGYNTASTSIPINKADRKRKLTLEQEFLLVLMKLRLSLLTKDLAFRFQVSPSLVSRIFTTWIKLMAKELAVLTIWPSSQQVRVTLPESFKRLYPKTRTIIDCSEVFMETPSSLEAQACLWSDYKHHCTVKFLICITPNGSVSWVSPVYGGRTSNVHIVRNSDNFVKYGF